MLQGPEKCKNKKIEREAGKYLDAREEGRATEREREGGRERRWRWRGKIDNDRGR